jgi:hypothetical protein
MISTASAAELVQDLRDNGFRFRLNEDGSLAVTPEERITPEIARAITTVGVPAIRAVLARKPGDVRAEVQWRRAVPLPLDERPAPPFPVRDVFPPWVAAMILAVAADAQVDPALPASQVFGILSGAVMGRAKVVLPTGHVEPLNTFHVQVAGSGERKTGPLMRLAAPVYAAEAEEQRKQIPIISAAQEEYDALKRRYEVLKDKEARAMKGAERDSLRLERKAVGEEFRRQIVPALPELLVEDITAEALAVHLAQQHECGLVLADESTLFENLLGRYSKDNAPNLALLLKAHDGSPHRVKRVTRGPVFLRHPLVAMSLSIQPGVAGEMIHHRAARDRGLPARCDFVVPASLVGSRTTTVPVIDATVVPVYTKKLQALLDLQFIALAQRAPDAAWPLIEMTPAAWRARNAFFLDLEAAMRAGGALEELRDWGSKMQGRVARFAGVIHLIGAPEDADQVRRPIAGETMDRAIVAARCYVEHTRLAFAMLTADPITSGARRIYAWAVRTKRTELTCRDVQHDIGSSGALRTREAVEPCLARLVDTGHFRLLRQGKRKGTRGRPRGAIYQVHPGGATPPEGSSVVSVVTSEGIPQGNPGSVEPDLDPSEDELRV